MFRARVGSFWMRALKACRGKKRRVDWTAVTASAGNPWPVKTETSPKDSPGPKRWRICSFPSAETLKIFTRPVDDHVKSRPLVAFGEDPLPLPAGTPHADPGQRLVLRLRKTGEKGNAGKLFGHIYHAALLKRENKLHISLTYVKALFCHSARYGGRNRRRTAQRRLQY